MKFLSFKILILCILLPPVLYIFSIQSIENHLKVRYAGEIEDIYIGDTQPLLNGSVRLKNAINKNIDIYFQTKELIAYGAKVNVTVITKRGAILYPPIFEEGEDDFPLSDPMQIAAGNYKLMNQGLVLDVEVKLDHDTPISLAVLSFYILLFLLVLYCYYRTGIRKAKQADMKKSREIERLLGLEKTHAESLKSLEKERERLSAESARMKKSIENEKVKASRNEDEMIEEIVTLEEEINKNNALQQEQQEEIDRLKEKIKDIDKGGSRKVSRPKTRGSDAVGKRFKVLYKNISVNDRAVSGYIDIADDLKIKGEEIIHQLNENPDLVSIKRKVFGKKSKHTILEVIFGYKGRLYFNKGKDGRIEVLAIGTKNSQSKDLEFLDNLTL